jgi:hypothetical protein
MSPMTDSGRLVENHSSLAKRRLITRRRLLFCQKALGQFTPGAYGSGSRPYGDGSRLYGWIAEPLDFVSRDCDFKALLVSDDRLAAKLGPETASNKPTANATT